MSTSSDVLFEQIDAVSTFLDTAGFDGEALQILDEAFRGDGVDVDAISPEAKTKLTHLMNALTILGVYHELVGYLNGFLETLLPEPPICERGMVPWIRWHRTVYKTDLKTAHGIAKQKWAEAGLL